MINHEKRMVLPLDELWNVGMHHGCPIEIEAVATRKG